MMASVHGDGSGEFWTGWPAKIGALAWEIVDDVMKADNLVSWSFKNRWALNRKKLGPRILELGRGQELHMKRRQTLTHYYARLCCRLVRFGKLEAIKGNADRALMYWAQAETEAERLYGSIVHPLAAKESARLRGNIRTGKERGSVTREKIRALLLSLPEWQRYEPSITNLVAKRMDSSATTAREHIKALGFGAKNKKKRGS